MKNSYRIYFDDRPLLIVHDTKEMPVNNLIEADIKNSDDINAAIAKMNEGSVAGMVLVTEDTGATFDLFKERFHFIQAGGGLVKNEKEEYLFIFRRGKWDLPKGKLDDGETIAECAVREVKEETGLQQVSLQDKLVDTWHVYHERGISILKESAWYNMSCSSSETLTPQTEEDIQQIKWLPRLQWPLIYDNTFPSIKDVLASAM